MATAQIHKFFLSVLLFVIICVVDSYRYGSVANTLHIASHKLEDKFGERTRIINADFSKLVTAASHERVRRSVAKHSNNTRLSTVTPLNDSHTQMIVHWAGLGSDVIIALSRNARNTESSTATANLYVSYDYGQSFQNVTEKFKIPGGQVVIDHYYNSKVLNSHYIFADVINRYIFTTTNYGRAVTPVQVPFKPKTISVHPTNVSIVLGMDEDDDRKRLYISQDFGFTWRMMQEGVKTFYWGVEGYDQPNDIYIEREQSTFVGSSKSVVTSRDFFVRDLRQLITDVEDFQMINQYMFVTKNVRLLGGTGNQLQLWVSYNRGQFVNAQFGNNLRRLDYFIADASEEQVFLCVQHNSTSTHLYISDITGSKYSLSLENVIYYNPKGAHNDTWLRYFSHDPFADVTKVEALRGVYIANQQIGDKFSLENQQSVITFDKGGEWRPITPPLKDLNNVPTNCTQPSKTEKVWKSNNCSLHLTQEFSRLYPGSRASDILSKKSAPGVIIGMGVLGNNLKHDPDMFISSDAGYTWYEVLEGNQYYTMGDHGGLIISVPQFTITNELYYSWNEGETWTVYKFHDEKIRVYGILTEPGEMTSIFTLFGSHTASHHWLIIQIDLHSIFPYTCKEEDYKLWSFPDQKPYFGCILGKKTVYERRVAHADCYNGRDYDRKIVQKNCTCGREDFECDLGFILEENFYGIADRCIEDPDFHGNLHEPPTPCPEGTFYPYSKGYRKVPGDTCHGGEEYRYAPYMLSCPVSETTEFLLYSSKQFIRKYSFGSQVDEGILDLDRQGMSGSIYAVTFDYRENTVYWFQDSPASIMKMNLTSGGNMTTVVQGRGMSTVESLVFDWTGGNLYWVDSVNKSIQVAKKNGKFRRVLIDETHLDRPRSLVLDPHFGLMYWTDWSRTNPRIMRSPMDGNVSAIVTIVSGTQNVFWPNGITIDHRDMKIYWTDGRLDCISSANFDGTAIRKIITGTYLTPHPYAIGIYKDRIYWTDWLKKAIFSADKHTGHGILTLKSNITNVMDLKVLDYLSQHDTTACSSGNGGCSQLCLPKPGVDRTAKNRTCKCDEKVPKLIIGNDGNERCGCPSGEEIINNKCVLGNGTKCPTDRYKCGNGVCIPATWRCDHENDCSDGSDEIDCSFPSCNDGSFMCVKDRKCIPEKWKCDFDDDCGDNSDETGCTYPQCTVAQFKCDNKRCINRNWTCDFDDDCHDGSDERNCTYSEVCSSEEFHCTKHQPRCIDSFRECDGARDCADGSDEVNCNGTTCSSLQFRCVSDGHCIYNTWKCDGDADCKDKSDEKDCPMTMPTTTAPRTTLPSGTCHFWQFTCHNRQCVWWTDRCDGANDCGDNSDEYNCEFSKPSSTTTVIPCNKYQFSCRNGQCIPKYQQCDGTENCVDGSDEMSCSRCSDREFQCNDTQCISESSLCDGFPDCRGGEDESNCGGDKKCNEFKCYTSEGCVPYSYVCDGHIDCADGSDENGQDCKNATVTPSACTNEFLCVSDGQCLPWIYVCDDVTHCVSMEDESGCGTNTPVPNIYLDRANGTALEIEWTVSNSRIPLKFIVSYMDEKTHVTKNDSDCVASPCTITGLKPMSSYDVTVYAVNNSTIYRRHQRKSFQTTQDFPDPPTHVTASTDEVNEGYIDVKWKEPSNDKGQILKYKVYCYNVNISSSRYAEVTTNWGRVTSARVEVPLKSGYLYKIWVTAFSSIGEGKASENYTLKYVEERIKDTVTDCTLQRQNASCYKLSWKAINSVTKYIVRFTDLWNMEQILSVTSNQVTVCELCPSGQYIFYVSGSNEVGEGPEAHFVLSNPVLPKYSLTWGKERPHSVDNGAYSVQWNPPADPYLTYTVFYNYKNMEEQSFAKNALRKDVKGSNSTVLANLRACESYLLRVAISAPGKCAPSPSLTLQTGEDDKAEPEILNIVFPTKTSVMVSWKAGCYDPTESVKYMIMVTEIRSGKSSKFETQMSTNLTMFHQFSELIRGANYILRIRSVVTGSRWSEPKNIEILPYESPSEFVVDYQDGSFSLHWYPPITDAEHVMQYEIYWKKSDAEFQSVDTVDKNTHSYTVKNTEQLTNNVFRVRMIADNGYPGLYAEKEIVIAAERASTPQAQTDIKISRTRMIAIIVSVTGVVIALVLVLGFFIVRHRRLQRSFLAFANSHYDTRSGTTTFESNELGEDEDSPMIQGFSDDEPLVIA